MDIEIDETAIDIEAGFGISDARGTELANVVKALFKEDIEALELFRKAMAEAKTTNEAYLVMFSIGMMLGKRLARA